MDYGFTVPIATRLPLPNVHFEMHNVAEPFRWDPDTMDLIHARHNDMSVSNIRYASYS